MGELLPVGVGLGERPETITAIEKELQMIAVRTHDSSGEAGVLVVTRPVKRRFKHDLLVGITLRFIETGSGLRLAKNIRNTVVADAIAAAEVGVRVVVERAPSETAGELRI